MSQLPDSGVIREAIAVLPPPEASSVRPISDGITPMLRQYLRIKSEHPDTILMFRLGDFYEMFFDDAIEAAGILDITLTCRNRNDPNPIPLCGVPYHSVEPYIAKLLERGRRIAICDQVEDPKSAKGVVKREVTRVITPGVVADGLGLDASSANFLAGIYIDDGRIGFALSDVSTGFFSAGELSSVEALVEEIGRSEPRELLVLRSLKDDVRVISMLQRFKERTLITYLDQSYFDGDLVKGLDGFIELRSNSMPAAFASSAVYRYLKEAQKGNLAHITSISPYANSRIMRLDESTKRHLELTRTMLDGKRSGSLLDAIDRTQSAMGARKLKQWLLYPLVDSKEIEGRLSAVEAIISDPNLLRGLPDICGRISDLERITSRISMGSASPRDLVALKESLISVKGLKGLLAPCDGVLNSLSDMIDPCEELKVLIEAQIVDEPPLAMKDGGIIRDGISPELDELRDIVAHGKDFIARIEAKEREATGISSLKIRFNKVFGYYLEVTNTNRDRVPIHYIRKQTLANAERYITPELKEYEEKVLGAEDKIRAIEFELFGSLRAEAALSAKRLYQTADAVAMIDALTSYARVAAEYNYCRPKVDDGYIIDIREGRHPVVERRNPIERFVPNDLLLDSTEHRLLLITGPNMAGKSTVMRQSALIVLMAQIGMYVPAASAQIGICDRIFTRVGASDALAQGQSTFMVEMSEAALILRDATARSLIVIDEIGRGTSTFDGLSIAWAVAEDIHDRVKARTVFATHYHELTELALTKSGIKNMNVAVREWNGEVIFLRRLVPGATSRSYGIAVARLAGLPEGVIERATEVLANLESDELNERGEPRIGDSHHMKQKNNSTSPYQYQLFTNPKDDGIRKRLSEIDTTAITPIEALNILHELKHTI